MINNEIINTVFLQSSYLFSSMWKAVHTNKLLRLLEIKTPETLSPPTNRVRGRSWTFQPWFSVTPPDNWRFGAYEIFLVLSMLTLIIAKDCGCPYQSAMTRQGADWPLLFQVPQVYISPPTDPGLLRRYQQLRFQGGHGAFHQLTRKTSQSRAQGFQIK